jgi:hypothetical protein
MTYEMTSQEKTMRCCGWLDDRPIKMCLEVAITKADELLNAIAEEQLVRLLTKIIVRDRKAARRQSGFSE